MKVLIAMDSFKGCMTSLEAGHAAAEGVWDRFPDAQIEIWPAADGGEGTVEALCRGLSGSIVEIRVTGPTGTPVLAKYGVLPDHRTAVMEIAQAAGLTLVPYDMRNPLDTTTYGIGEMIRHAIRRGCRRFLIGLGGSATNDAGLGMLQALGFDCLDRFGAPVAPYGAGLGELCEIRSDRIEPFLADCEFYAACDVRNPLCGENGASAVYGPQKGADAVTITQMDEWLRSFAKLTGGDPDLRGSGAAGGLGYTFRTVFGAGLEPGSTLVMRETGLAQAIFEADLILTGEGCIDDQTLMGKIPAEIARTAHDAHKPVIAFGGQVKGAGSLFDGLYCITPEGMPHDTAMLPDTAKINLRLAAAHAMDETVLEN